MTTLLKLNILGNLSQQRCYLSTSPILHSWFVKLTNVTQVNTEAAIPKHTRKRNYPLTYEQRQFPKFIGHTKTWNTFNTSNLRDGKRKAEIVSDDLFLRQFIYGTWHSLFATELIIKRRHNMIILSGLVTRTIHPRRMYFLIDMAMQMCNKRATQVATNLVRQLARPVRMKIEDDHSEVEYTHIPLPNTLVSMSKTLLHGNASITTGLNSTISVRHAHTDIQVPNFDFYRRKARLDSSKSYRDADDNTSPYSYLAPVGLAITSAYMAKYIVRDIAAYVGPAKDVMSLAKVEIKLDAVPVGKNAVFEWRNKPIFVRHRTAQEIAREQGVNVAQLRDPQNDADRVQKSEWLIVIGICTHLGCIPIANAGEFGGYYCPCHGSHYDASGRIRKGPAPLNLEVPQYVFKDDSTVVIG
ncbi:unnamed protein product [Rotaria socialis]|uniref:Rieske domain-containing protein n=2 Tax=Rotaria socialis TaxID=392032 RepID=A0A820GCN5_9BILA|nr:unnamed protein product [Rotaria socialis]CAF4153566.1 unnamed protein product [Rotaria socialis]CAF4275777.1 unnamed protein product [Rotaria socialis]